MLCSGGAAAGTPNASTVARYIRSLPHSTARYWFVVFADENGGPDGNGTHTWIGVVDAVTGKVIICIGFRAKSDPAHTPPRAPHPRSPTTQVGLFRSRTYPLTDDNAPNVIAELTLLSATGGGLEMPKHGTYYAGAYNCTSWVVEFYAAVFGRHITVGTVASAVFGAAYTPKAFGTFLRGDHDNGSVLITVDPITGDLGFQEENGETFYLEP